MTNEYRMTNDTNTGRMEQDARSRCICVANWDFVIIASLGFSH